jgi:hypothetical protein
MCRWNVVVKDAHLQTDKEVLVTLAPGPEERVVAPWVQTASVMMNWDPRVSIPCCGQVLWEMPLLQGWGWRSTDDGKGAIGGEAETRIGLR